MKKEYKIKCLEGDYSRIIITEDFVARNNFKLERTQEEIFKRIKDSNAFDFANDVLIDYLDFETARPLLKIEYAKKIEEGEEKWEKINDVFETAQDFLDYMVFGWGKALDERGLSASRTISKCGHWLWLMGRDDLRMLISDDSLYDPYGSPALIAVCEKMGIEVPNELKDFSKIKC